MRTQDPRFRYYGFLWFQVLPNKISFFVVAFRGINIENCDPFFSLKERAQTTIRGSSLESFLKEPPLALNQRAH